MPGGGTGDSRRLRFAFLAPCAGEAFFRPVKRGMSDAAAALGVDCAFGGTDDVDLPLQAELARRAMAEGVDGLALSIVHPTALNEVVREARSRGTPVVAFNVDASHRSSGCLSAVLQDVYRAGQALGQRASPAIPDGAAVLLTVHSAGISALDDRLRGILEGLAGRGISHEVLTTGTDPARAAEVVAEALRARPGIAAVLGTGQADTEGAGLAVERGFAGRRPYVAGFDLSPEILRLIGNGSIAWTVDQQPYAQGYYPVVQLALYCRYGIRPSDIDTGATLIGREDAEGVAALSAAGYR